MKIAPIPAAALLLLVFTTPASATVRLPDVLGDRMVLQQQADVSLWGWAFAGETVLVETSWGVKTRGVANVRGEWSVKVRTPAAQSLTKGLRPEHITFTVLNENAVQIKDILIGEVWLCSGQSNMEMVLRPGYPPGWCAWFGEASWDEESRKAERTGLRLFNVTRAVAATPQADCTSTLPGHGLQPADASGLIPASKRGWQTCTSEARPCFPAVPYYFGSALQDKLDVPVGLVAANVGGTPIECWMSLDTLHSVAGYSNVTITALNPFAGSPSSLFNGMIAPLVPMKIQGVIWYQGESNVGNPIPYAALFQALIADWRKAFDCVDMPFYFVQIAPYRYGRGTKPAELREAQAAALQLKNTGMALTIDVSDVSNIHPKNKKDVGNRLALQALAKTYGHREIAADGPMPESLTAGSGKLRVVFQEVGGGLVARDGKPLTCFEIAGENGSFVAAEAVIEGRTVVVFSTAVAQPKAVRFAWGEAAVPNLTSGNGMPVAQFRMTLK
ncbi:MAG: sialate O-acetylesterase [bacterium]